MAISLHRRDITAETWDETLTKITKTNEHNLELLEGEVPGFLLDDNGLQTVPLTNKEWAQWVGYEHEHRTLWFRAPMKRGRGGTLYLGRWGAVSCWALARAVAWNAALYIHLTAGRLSPSAVPATVARAMRMSTCPDAMLSPMCHAITMMVMNTLMSISDPRAGQVNRIGLALLEEDLEGRLRGRTCTNKALRRSICMRLVARGIGGCSTRSEQERMLQKVLREEDRLKASALRSIRRMLQEDKTLLKHNGGKPLLLQFTTGERHSQQKQVQGGAALDRNMERVHSILCKMSSGKALTGAERVFKCKHRDLFASC